jgi:hypothetical protein
MVAAEYEESKGKEPVLTIDFSAPSLNALNMPGGSIYRRVLEGPEAKAVDKALERMSLDVPIKKTIS